MRRSQVRPSLLIGFTLFEVVSLVPAACGRSASVGVGEACDSCSLSQLTVVNRSLTAGDPLFVEATITPAVSVPIENAIQITTASDTETVAIRPQVCRIEGLSVVCGKLFLLAAEGVSFSDLGPAIRQAGAVFVTEITPRVGVVRVPIGEELAMQTRLRSIPGIEAVDLVYMAYQRQPGARDPAQTGIAQISTAPDRARPHDEVLQVRPGDTVIISPIMRGPARPITLTVGGVEGS